jgi:hypothetical protein
MNGMTYHELAALDELPGESICRATIAAQEYGGVETLSDEELSQAAKLDADIAWDDDTAKVKHILSGIELTGTILDALVDSIADLRGRTPARFSEAEHLLAAAIPLLEELVIDGFKDAI